jgi:hypothetical protein
MQHQWYSDEYNQSVTQQHHDFIKGNLEQEKATFQANCGLFHNVNPFLSSLSNDFLADVVGSAIPTQFSNLHSTSSIASHIPMNFEDDNQNINPS